MKNILGVTNFEAKEIRKIMTNSTSKQNFFNQLKSKVAAYKFDGVNIDFEGLYNADKGAVLNNFMTDLTNFLHTEFPGSEVSFAGPVVNWGNYWDLLGLVKSCDYVFIMGYAFYGGWSTTSGPNSPLTGGSRNIATALNNDYAAAVANYPERVVLGLPYYGIHWTTETSSAYSKVIDFVANPKYRSAILKAETNGKIWDTNSKTVWTRWQDSEWNQIWFDDDSSLGLKYDLAIAKNIGGIGMWALGYDGDRAELWNLISKKFGDGSVSIPSKPNTFYIKDNGLNSVTLNFNKSLFADFYEVYKSTDAVHYKSLGNFSTNKIAIENMNSDSIYFFKVRAGNSTGLSEFTEVLCASQKNSYNKILLVNGFDRISNTTNNFDAVKFWFEPLAETYSDFISTSNEAVIQGLVDLNDYEIVMWILMDESTEDETFSGVEQSLIKNFLEQNGNFFISGSEIGWDLVEKGSAADKDFYKNYLKANYISDAPNNKSKTYYTLEILQNSLSFNIDGNTFGFDDGNHGSIDVDWPDAIEAFGGSENLFKYVNTSNYAGIFYWGDFSNNIGHGKIVYFSFPFESIYPAETRVKIWNGVYEFLIYQPSVKGKNTVADNFYLSQNYPNPFNPSTTIQYSIPSSTEYYSVLQNVSLKVYDILGREVATLVNENKLAGNYQVEFNSVHIPGLSSGVYFYTLRSGQFSETKKMLLLR